MISIGLAILLWMPASCATTLSQDLALLGQQLESLAHKIPTPRTSVKPTVPTGETDEERELRESLEYEAVIQASRAEAAATQRSVPAQQEQKKKTDAVSAIEQVKIYPLRAAMQEGGDCGFHGIKNGLALLDWAQGTISSQERDRRLLDPAKNYIEQLRTCSRDKTVIDDSSFNQVLRDFGGLKTRKDSFVVIANIFEAEQNLVSQQPQFETGLYPGIGYAIDDLQKHENAAYDFIVADAIAGGQRLAAGHYISILAKRNKKVLELYLTDSFTEEPMNAVAKKKVDALARIIQNAKNPEELKKVFGKNDQ
jgi:hypothetical protein